MADSLRVYTCRKMRASVLRAAIAGHACRRPAPHLADGLLLVAEGARELVGRLLLLHHLLYHLLLHLLYPLLLHLLYLFLLHLLYLLLLHLLYLLLLHLLLLHLLYLLLLHLLH